MDSPQTAGLFKELYPNFKITERNWTGWDYQSASIVDYTLEQMICYTRVRDKGEFREIVEIYSGENYVYGSNKRSYSRVYKVDEIPSKHIDLIFVLKTTMTKKLGTKLLTS